MADRERVDHLLGLLQEYVRHLSALGETPVERVRSDAVVRGALERYLQLAIQATLDTGQHVIAMFGFAQPKSYAEIPSVLGNAGVLDKGFANELAAMARLRNRLVHVYGDVDPDLLSEFVRTRLGDFDRFAAELVRYLDEAQAEG